MKYIRIFTILAAMLAMNLTTYAQTDGGPCGGLQWSYDGSTHVLTIYGSGAMPDFENHREAPWAYYKDVITAINLPYGLTYIGKEAFSQCEELQSITIPSKVVEIGDHAFYDCKKLATVTFNEESELSTIGTYAFAHCSALSTIALPASLTKILTLAFNECTLLTAIDIPEHVYWLEYGSFDGCSLLANVTVHWTDLSSLRVDQDLFGNIASGAILHVPCGTEDIYSAAAQWSSFTIDDPCPSGQCGDNLYWAYNTNTHVLTITGTGDMYDYTASTQPWSAFRNEMTTISFPAGITHVGNNAFVYCNSVTSPVTIPASVESIGSYAFAQCNFAMVTFESGSQLTTIGLNAFYRCASLTTIEIPAGVTYIGDLAFSKATSLATVTFAGNSLTSIEGQIFSECTSLSTIELPASVTTIDEFAFSGCSLLSSVTLSTSLTTIEEYAFEKCIALTAIDIPVGVTMIDYYAFKECSSLANVTVHWTSVGDLPMVGHDMFYEIASSPTLHVPCGTTSLYSAAAQWSSFTIDDPCYAIRANADPNDGTTYYSTFYDGQVQYLIPSGVEAYAANIDDAKNLLLTKIAGSGDVLPSQTAVILKSRNLSFYTLEKSDGSPVDITATNVLLGTDEPKAAPDNCYVLSGHSTDNTITCVGFYQYTGTLKAHKAYTIYPAMPGTQSPAPRYMPFIFNNTEGFEDVQPATINTQKRLENGQLIIEKNGIRYNAVGQRIK